VTTTSQTLKRQRYRARMTRLLKKMEGPYEIAVYRELRGTAQAVAFQVEADVNASVSDIVIAHRTRLRRIIKQQGERIAKVFGAEITRHLARAQRKDATQNFFLGISRFFDSYAFDASALISANTQAIIFQTLKAGLTSGLGAREMARSIRAEVGDRVRADRIARTEAHTASSAGMEYAVEETEIEVVRVWSSAEDGRTRRSHASADGQKRRMGEPFVVGGARMKFPGDPSGPASERINCRCVLLYDPVT
jgi:uncharacterized protein with gpF-like domain